MFAYNCKNDLCRVAIVALLQMAAASFLVPSLSGLNSRPNRIRHSVRVNIRRRERITPPPIVTSKRLSSMQVINCFVV